MHDGVYYLLVAFFFTHELDAVRRREWRVLPLTSFMPDKVDEHVFIWIHVPIFAGIIWAGAEGKYLRPALAAFAIVHVGLHWLYRRYPAYEFNNWSSWGLILLTGVMGFVYLLLAVLS